MTDVDRRRLLGSLAAAGLASWPPMTWARQAEVDSPARRLFATWLERMNAGDPRALDAFLKATYPTNTDPWVSLSQVSGGLVVDAVESATPTAVTVRTRERRADGWLRLVFKVDPADRRRIADIGLSAVGPPPGVSPPPRMSPARLFGALAGTLRAAAAEDRFSGSVRVSANGRPIFVAGFGFADREHRVPNTANTRFRYASLGKMFTSVAIMQLVEAGKVTLDAPVSRYIADYPNRDLANGVTVDDLMTHTGGTGGIFGPQFDAHRRDLKTHADYIRLFGDRPPLFPPGSRFAYSDYGFILLGEIIQRASGEDYYDYITRRILAPARMPDTGFDPEDVAAPRRAMGYTWSAGRLTSTAGALPYRATAAGGGYSTVGDLDAFGAALTGARLLGPETTDRLLKGQGAAQGGRRYRYDIGGRTSPGLAFIGHDGQDAGAHCKLMIFPDSGFMVVVLSNFDPPAAALPANFIVNRLEGLH